MIKLNHITKRFESGGRTVTAVDDVSLAINAGEVFGIIGFSGAGKSTLVRCINLLERPTSGEVIVDGVDLTQLDEKALRQVRQRIGMIFQHFNLMPSRTVTENIEMPLKLTTLTPAERKAKISSLLELVELSDKADAYPSQLSGGQKQLLTIARAMLANRRLLILDEATVVEVPAMFFTAAMNLPYEGGGFQFCPKADPKDDLLDIIVVSGLSKFKILCLLPTAYKGKHTKFKGIYTYQCKSAKIESVQVLPVHTDGEADLRSDTATFALEPDRIRFIRS